MSMTLIEHIEVGSGGVASIEFTSIPADYTDLYVVASVRQNGQTTGNGGFVYKMTFNGSTSNYSSRLLRGSGSAVTSYTDTSILFFGNASDNTTNSFGSSAITIANYLSSNAKSVSVDATQETNATAAYQAINAGLWNDASAITSVKLESIYATNLIQYSSATLYGITAGSDGTTVVS